MILHGHFGNMSPAFPGLVVVKTFQSVRRAAGRTGSPTWWPAPFPLPSPPFLLIGQGFELEAGRVPAERGRAGFLAVGDGVGSGGRLPGRPWGTIVGHDFLLMGWGHKSSRWDAALFAGAVRRRGKLRPERPAATGARRHILVYTFSSPAASSLLCHFHGKIKNCRKKTGTPLLETSPIRRHIAGRQGQA
jgi:hypothetical protein